MGFMVSGIGLMAFSSCDVNSGCEIVDIDWLTATLSMQRRVATEGGDDP